MALETKRIFHINADVSTAKNTQLVVEAVADTDLGFKMWGGKDGDGNTVKFLAKDKSARVTTLNISGLTAVASLLKTDGAGAISAGLITVANLNSYLSDGPITASLAAGYVGYGSVGGVLTGKSTFVFKTADNYLGIGDATPGCGLDMGGDNPTYVGGDSRNINCTNIECSNIYMDNNLRLPNETEGAILYLDNSTPGIMVADVANFNYKKTTSMYRTINAGGAAQTDIISNGSTSGKVDIVSYGATSTSRAYLRSEGTTVSAYTQVTATAVSGTAQVIIRAKRNTALGQSAIDLQHNQASFTSTGNITVSTMQAAAAEIDILSSTDDASYSPKITIKANKTVGAGFGSAQVDIISSSIGSGEAGSASIVNVIAHTDNGTAGTHEANLICQIGSTDYEISVQPSLVDFNNIATVDFNGAKLRNIDNASWGAPTAAGFATSTITANFSTGKDIQTVSIDADATTLTLTAPVGTAAKGLQIIITASGADRDIGGGAGFNGVKWDEGVNLAIISKTIPSGKVGIMGLTYVLPNWYGSFLVTT